jgi:hypothetical protein
MTDLEPLIDVTGVRVLARYVVKLTFDDRDVRVIDLEPLLWGPMFEPIVARLQPVPPGARRSERRDDRVAQRRRYLPTNAVCRIKARRTSLSTLSHCGRDHVIDYN